MNSAPYYYDYINSTTSSVSPSTVHIHNTAMAHFFKRYLLQKAMSVFKWTLPETWDKDYFLYTLYCYGYIAIVNTNKYGVIPQQCGLQGYNIFYRPSDVVVVNPLLRNMLQLKIDVNCTVIKLQPDYGGIMDIVDFYGDLMALASETAGINLVNSKLSYVFGAKNKAGAESFKKLYDQIQEGNPAAVFDKDLLNTDGTPAWDIFQQNVGQNYIVGDILSDLRKIENMFNTAVGIPNANTDKKERLVVSEVESNNVETSTLCEMWLDNIKKEFEKTNEMFGISLGVEWRENPKGSDNNGNTVNTGAVQL